MVSSTGTLVKRLSTSNDAINPWGELPLMMSMKSFDDLRLNFVGVNGVNKLHSFLARLYVGAGICEMIGLNGLPSL